MNSTLFLVVRAAHVTAAAIWIGSHIFSTFMLMPAIDASGPSGGQVMMRINRRGIVVYMLSVAVLTLASGLVLYWRFTGGFDPALAATHAGLAFGLGGSAGILAGAIGGGSSVEAPGGWERSPASSKRSPTTRGGPPSCRRRRRCGGG